MTFVSLTEVDAEKIKTVVHMKLSGRLKKEGANIFDAFRSAVCSRREGIHLHYS